MITYAVCTSAGEEDTFPTRTGAETYIAQMRFWDGIRRWIVVHEPPHTTYADRAYATHADQRQADRDEHRTRNRRR